MLYRVARFIARTFLLVYCRLSVTGQNNLPGNGPALLVANHASFLDPIVLGCAVKREVHFMAKAELFKIPVLGWLLPGLHAFPVHRGIGDRQAIKTSLALLSSGEVVVIFPEGTRSPDGSLQPGQSGAAFLALKTGIPVVPAAICGSDKVFCRGSFFIRPARIRVNIGEPMFFEKRERVERQEMAAATDRIMKGIADLLESQ